MEQTSRLSIVIDTGNAQNNLERLRASLRGLSTDGTTASNILSRMGATGGLSNIINRVGQTNNAFRQFSQMVNNTHNNFNTFNRTVNNASTNIMRMGDTINRTTNNITRMGDTINRNITVINNYNRSLSGTHDALSRLQGLLTGGMFGVFALSVAKTADSMQETHSQIKLVTKSHEEYLVVADRLHEMAGKNLKDFQATAGLYTNSARALGQLGKSQEEVLKFTNAVSLAMSVGGKSAQEQASALLQLGQAMQSGALQGDEFRSLAENAPIMLDLVAESLGKTRGEVRELSKEGKITAEVMYKAMADATPKLQEMFDKMPVTMSQGFSVLKNEYRKFTHEFMNGEGGISSVVAKGLVDVSRNFENFATILMGTAATWGVLKVAQSSFITTTIPALIAGTTGSISTFYAQGVAMLTTATSTSALSRALTMATLRGASFAVSVAVGTREILRKAVAVGTATRTFLAHSASVLRSSMSVAGLRANIGLLTRSVLTNTGAFLRGTVAVQAKTLAMGALGVASRATAGTVGVLAGSIKSLGAIINAHPIMFLSTVIFGVVASTEGLQGAMDSLSDTVKVVGSIFGEFITTTGHGLKNGIGSAIDWVADLLGKKSKDGTSVANKAFNELFGNTEKGFLGILQVIARVFDIAAAGFWGFVDYGSQQFDNMVIKAKNAWSSLQSFFGFGDGYQIPTIEVSFSDAFKKALANQKANGMESLLLSHNGRVQANKSLDLSAVDLTVPSQAQTPSSSDKDKDKKGKKGKEPKQLITGELAEAIFWLSDKYKLNPNDVAAVISFETSGTFSTNARNPNSSGTGLFQLMQYSDGTDHGGNSKKWDYYGLTRNQFGALPPMEQMYYFDKFFQSKKLRQGASLGDIYDAVAGYGYKRGTKAYKQNEVWDADGDGVIRKREAVTAKAFKKHIRNYFPNGIDLQAVGKAQSDVAKINAKNDEVVQKSQQEIQSWFATERQKRDEEFIRKQNEIINNFSGNPEMGKLLDQLTDNYVKSDKYFELKFELETKGDMMNIWERADKELALKLSEIDLSDLSDEQKKLRKDMAHEAHARRTFAMVIEEQEKDLRLNSWRRSPLEVFQTERDIAINKINITRTAEEMTQGYTPEQQAIDDFYSMKIAKYHESQAKKIADFEKIIADTTKNGHGASLLNMMGEKYLPKPTFAKMQLQNTHEQRLAEENQRFNDLVNSINAQNEDGQFEIEDIKERQRLIQEAEIFHQTELKAIKEKFAEENKQLEVDAFSQSMQTYSSAFGEMSGIIKAFGGEQSKAYRTMFAVSKSFALADIGVKMGQAIAQTWSDPTATTIWQKLANVAKVTLAQGHLMKMVSTVKGFKTGGYTGNVGTSQIAGVVHGQEYVVNAKATKRIGVDNLNKLNSGGSLGGNVNNISVNVTVNADGSSNVQASHQLGKEMGQAIVAVVQNELRKEMLQGGMLDRYYRR